MCVESGSMMEACMHLGRSCITFEVDGLCLSKKKFSLLAVQFGGARLRMEENLQLLRKQKDIGRYIWSSRHDLCRYWDEKESAFLSLYAEPTQVHTVLSYSC